MDLKNMKINIRIKNIDELKTLLEEMKSIIDKIQNFNFDIEINQYEHIQDKRH